VSESLYRFGDHVRGIPGLQVDGELACIDTHDIDEVADEPIHPGDIPLDALHSGDGSPPLVGPRCLLCNQPRVAGDRTEQIPQVVADDPHEIVAVRDRVVRAGALGQQVLIGLLPLERQERGERAGLLLALAAKTFVRGRALVPQRLVFAGSFFRQGIAHSRPGLGSVELVVSLVARRIEHGVRLLARAVDDPVRLFFYARSALFQHVIGILALGAQTLVRLRALRFRLFGVSAHGPDVTLFTPDMR
jgi:hypothetical protein